MPSKIQDVRVRAVRVPMPEPHRTATGVITESPLVLVDVITSDGIVGHGIVFTYTAAALKPVADFIGNIAHFLRDQPLAPVCVTDQLAARFRLLGTQGLVGMALAGIDMALWDAHARTQELSLTRLLGGVARPLQAYGAVGHDGPAESARVAEGWASRGFEGVKAKIGYPTLVEDIAVILEMRRAVGNQVAIMVDYNQCLTPAEATQRILALDELGLTWVEEPTLAHDYQSHAAIAAAVKTPIQCGENWWGPLDFRHAVEAKASDFVMPEVMKIGGVTGWRRAVAMAEAHGLRVSSHLWPEVSAQLLATTPMAHWLEYADWWNPILAEPLHIKNGMAYPSETPGSGIGWNEDAVARYSV